MCARASQTRRWSQFRGRQFLSQQSCLELLHDPGDSQGRIWGTRRVVYGDSQGRIGLAGSYMDIRQISCDEASLW